MLKYAYKTFPLELPNRIFIKKKKTNTHKTSHTSLPKPYQTFKHTPNIYSSSTIWASYCSSTNQISTVTRPFGRATIHPQTKYLPIFYNIFSLFSHGCCLLSLSTLCATNEEVNQEPIWRFGANSPRKVTVKEIRADLKQTSRSML